jgi:hypothetical protein
MAKKLGLLMEQICAIMMSGSSRNYDTKERSKMMRTVKFLQYVLLSGLLLALVGSVGLGLAQGPNPPEGEMQPQGEVSIAGAVSSKFSYQGVLKEDGSPVTGSRDMTFRLFSDGTCSTKVGSDIVKGGVPVADGLFSVEVPVTQSNFNGQGLWLEVEVGGTKIGCQEIVPVPYALSLRPGATIADLTSDVKLNYSSGKINNWSKRGVYSKTEGTSADTTYYGVYGRGTDYGVYGYSESGAAVYGYGDVKQNRTGDGLVKAAVYAYCGSCLLCIPERSFNNVTTGAMGCICGSSAGQCTIDFGFDISDRFWVATAVDTDDRGVACELGGNNNQLDCFHWYGSTGAGTDGYIMVLVY